MTLGGTSPGGGFAPTGGTSPAGGGTPSTGGTQPNTGGSPVGGAGAGGEAPLAEADLVRCFEDADCVVVPYDHCCGATRRAIHEAHRDEYEAHPEWQAFSEPEACVERTYWIAPLSNGLEPPTATHVVWFSDEQLPLEVTGDFLSIRPRADGELEGGIPFTTADGSELSGPLVIPDPWSSV